MLEWLPQGMEPATRSRRLPLRAVQLMAVTLVACASRHPGPSVDVPKAEPDRVGIRAASGDHLSEEIFAIRRLIGSEAMRHIMPDSAAGSALCRCGLQPIRARIVHLP